MTGGLRARADAATAIALQGEDRAWTWLELADEVDALAARLLAEGVRCLASLLDNGPAWVVADLAAWQAEVVHLPLPGFFTPAQVAHALQASGADRVLCDPRAAAAFGPPGPAVVVAGQACAWVHRDAPTVPMPPGTAKLTFTSGTTGTPKGVCLDRAALLAVAEGIADATLPLGITHHLCALPLPVLLENVAGVLAPLRRGARCTVLPLQQLGLSGAARFDPAVFDAQVRRQRPDSLILLPQMLRAWTGWLARRGESAPAGLRLVAVGGAAVGERLIHAARGAGIPAFEGYGLSEGASVQTLNLPAADRVGSAGRVLPHARIRLAPDGEIEVAGSLFAGYLGDRRPPPAWWPTGDLGEIDADGYLWVRGRKKQVLITAYGRNVSPEWVETALRGDDTIAQAVVFGDGEPSLAAVVWPMSDAVSDAALGQAVETTNAGLPDYARIGHWLRADTAFSAETGLATPNGRPQRAAILALYGAALARQRALTTDTLP